VVQSGAADSRPPNAPTADSSELGDPAPEAPRTAPRLRHADSALSQPWITCLFAGHERFVSEVLEVCQHRGQSGLIVFDTRRQPDPAPQTHPDSSLRA
jgi:hypothetical protein